MTAPALKTLHCSLGELYGLYYAVVFNERSVDHRWERMEWTIPVHFLDS